jgi:type I restriction enzyme S subunit
MQFKEYPSYKNSGVEWLGDVPSDWHVKRFGYIFSENKTKNRGLIENNVLSLSYGNIKEKMSKITKDFCLNLLKHIN